MFGISFFNPFYAHRLFGAPTTAVPARGFGNRTALDLLGLCAFSMALLRPESSTPTISPG
ncbi:hypothetical protein BS47DRAFT_1347724 [Hydnum rufescens UP504]|uniref:Uncharacterized protein n=1 Tax=Hydnum rufescens UP504 TaxID=1448309 RepID=A0A9P6DUH4_9AGAM|nr:hypothetical protein BS47DRAFT_1347724 [Hydnum rufescens UP504]